MANKDASRSSDQEILLQYHSLVRFLGSILPSNTEIVLHDLSQLDKSVVAIENGAVSGRKIGSPATDFALRVARDGANEDLDFISNYAGHSPKNASPMRSASYFVRNGSRVIGLLCINIDESAYRDAGRALESLLGLYPQPAAPSDPAAEPEILASSVEEIIDNALCAALQDLGLSKHGLDNHERTAVFERLDIAGVFQLKGAVAELAVQLGISEPTVYRTLRAIRGDLP